MAYYTNGVLHQCTKPMVYYTVHQKGEEISFIQNTPSICLAAEGEFKGFFPLLNVLEANGTAILGLEVGWIIICK